LKANAAIEVAGSGEIKISTGIDSGSRSFYFAISAGEWAGTTGRGKVFCETASGKLKGATRSPIAPFSWWAGAI
jgi:hypothetical protein